MKAKTYERQSQSGNHKKPFVLSLSKHEAARQAAYDRVQAKARKVQILVYRVAAYRQ